MEGEDTIENNFEARNAMNKETFYSDAAEYWSKVPRTVNGMLGGFGKISSTDIEGSINFLRPFFQAPWPERLQTRRALDCGAGIGRVTKHLLLPLFETVDLVEQDPSFVKQAPKYIGDSSGRVERFINKGLQDFTPEPGRYDLIWIQWVLGHLSDEHLVAFLRRCVKGLAEGGLICMKENIACEGVVLDDEDSSVTRSAPILKGLIKAAGLKIIKAEGQDKFPVGLFKVDMYAMR